VRIISDRTLSGEAAAVSDVRWVSDDALYFTSYRSGVLQVAASSGTVTRVAFAEPGKNCPSCVNLGVSDTDIVTSFPVISLAWKQTTKPQIHTFMFDAVVDLDVHDDRLLILGSRKEGGEWAPDGAVAWMGSLNSGLQDLRPVLYSSRGPKEMTVARCGILEPGATRFFEDGSYVIVPGFEPDAYLYDRTGKLVYTWQTAKLGFLDRCDLTDTMVQAVLRDPEQRAKYRNKRVLIDDLLPTRAGPALLLYRMQEGVAHWSMLILHRDRPPSRIELPFTSPSDVSSLRADIRGNRIAFLIRTYGNWRPNTKQTSRLIIAELR
jgi:hypothetical protein